MKWTHTPPHLLNKHQLAQALKESANIIRSMGREDLALVLIEVAAQTVSSDSQTAELFLQSLKLDLGTQQQRLKEFLTKYHS